MTEPLTRPVEMVDHERLRQLTFAAQAHWGYDPDFVARWAGTVGTVTSSWGRTLPVMEVEL